MQAARLMMHRSTKFSQGSSRPKVTRSDISVLGLLGRRQPRAQPSVSRDREETPHVSENQLGSDFIINPVLPPKSRNDQEKSGIIYRGGSLTKMRQESNITGKRSCLQLAHWLLDDLLQDLVREVTLATFQRSTRDFVDTFLTEMAIRHCASDIISEMVPLILTGLVEKVLREKAVNDVIEAELFPEVFVEEARSVALSEVARCESQVAIQQLSQVWQYAGSRMKDVFLMDSLLELVTNKAQSFPEKQQSGRLLDSWMLDVLFYQLFSSLQQRTITIENIPLRNHHRQIFTDIALDMILSEFCQSLNEDMEHWLEFEQQMEEGAG